MSGKVDVQLEDFTEGFTAKRALEGGRTPRGLGVTRGNRAAGEGFSVTGDGI